MSLDKIYKWWFAIVLLLAIFSCPELPIAFIPVDVFLYVSLCGSIVFVVTLFVFYDKYIDRVSTIEKDIKQMRKDVQSIHKAMRFTCTWEDCIYYGKAPITKCSDCIRNQKCDEGAIDHYENG